MRKRTYIQPSISIVLLQYSQQLLNASNIQSIGLGLGNLDYDDNGGNQENAW